MKSHELLRWVFSRHKPTIVTSSFGTHSAVLLHMISRINPQANIVWVDTQYNTSQTLKFKARISELLDLKVSSYIGKTWDSPIPLVNTPEHDAFVEQIKLEPFRRAVLDFRPEFWITGLRKEQTEFRQGLRAISQTDGITKICPLLDWTESQMIAYLEKYNLPDVSEYFDPTKIHNNQECGLHTNYFQIEEAT